jgi:hypothetical protein
MGAKRLSKKKKDAAKGVRPPTRPENGSACGLQVPLYSTPFFI